MVYFSTKNLTQIKNLLDFRSINNVIKSTGWVHAIRKHKKTVFLHLNDGSTSRHLQVVLPIDKFKEDIKFGSCIAVEGELIKSQRDEQPVELIANEISVIGTCDENFPIKIYQNQSFDSLRQHLHLRQRSPVVSALMRLRNIANYAMHQYFQKKEFIQITTPILTTNDCEGAGETFKVGISNDKNEQKEEFFYEPTFLTVSSQLHLEASVSALSRVYTISPTFRAENNNTRHHVSEFTMVEAEMAFVYSVNDLTHIVEELLKFTIEKLVTSQDFQFFINKISTNNNHFKLVDTILQTPFKSISYNEAIQILKNHQSQFKAKIEWGLDMQREHEQFLVNHFDSVPVFVCEYPAAIKPFYAKINAKDNQLVDAFDLLGPRVGEICGGSLREENLVTLDNAIHQKNIKGLDWYLELRRYGTCPHGGFGIGFDRFLQVILAIPNIRDVIPFPRYADSCKL